MEPIKYAWQEECLEAWFSNGCRGIVSAVTGSGKTQMAVKAMGKLDQELSGELRVDIVVPTGALLLQWERVLKEAGADRKDVGCCGGGRFEKGRKKYMLYIVNSARYQLARSILKGLREGENVLLVADECHHYASGENQKIFEFLPFLEKVPGKYFSLGLSATPEVEGYGTVLVPALGKGIYRYGLDKALRRGTVAEFVIFQIALPFREEEREEYEGLTERMSVLHKKLAHGHGYLKNCGAAQFFSYLRQISAGKDKKSARMARGYLALAFRRKRIACMAENRGVCVRLLLKELKADSRVLIFGESIEQAERLYGQLREEYAEKVGRYHSRMGVQANRNILGRFRDGRVRILITCRALDEGLDVPEATVGIILSGTSVKRQRIQRLGRILRNGGGGKMAGLYYLYVQDSREEKAYFPRGGEYFWTEDVLFDSGEDTFLYPDYEKAADNILRKLREREAGQEAYGEAARCLMEGELRPDWLVNPAECREKMEAAEDTHEKNYWYCMQQMAAEKRKWGMKAVLEER